MAASSRISKVNPYRLWMTIGSLSLVVLAVIGYRITRISADENQRIIDYQLATLVKSRNTELTQGRYRDFVEGVGRDFAELHVEIASSAERFEFGLRPTNGHCSSMAVHSGIAVPNSPLSVTMCRPYQSPASTIPDEFHRNEYIYRTWSKNALAHVTETFNRVFYGNKLPAEKDFATYCDNIAQLGQMLAKIAPHRTN